MNEIEISERPLAARLRHRWPRRLLLGGLIFAAVCLAIPIFYFILSTDRALREAAAEADRLDPGWRTTELEAKREIIPDGDNSALLLLEAKRLMPMNWPFWEYPQAVQPGERPKLVALREELHSLQPPLQLDQALVGGLHQELRRAGESLAAARKIVNLRNGRYPANYSILLNLHRVVRLLAYEALVRAQEQAMDAALTSSRGLLNCGRSTGDEPSMWSRFFRVGLNQMAARQVERTLAQGEASETALSSIQSEFEDEAEQQSLLLAVRGQRAGMDRHFQAVQDGEIKPTPIGSPRGLDYFDLLWIPSVTKRIRATVLKRHNQYVEMAKLPVEQQVKRTKELREAERDLPELARFYLEPLRIAPFHRDRAELRGAVVMIAVERYRRAKNRWPDTLAELVPEYLAKVPLDPFDGALLRYRRLGDGVVIYSVGPDGHDDAGNLEGLQDLSEIITGAPAKKGTDLGFRLWDVSKRRQPPEPSLAPLSRSP